MKQKKTHSVYIDTKIDKTQIASNFKVKLNNWFLRNNIKNNDNYESEWFLSVKTLAMFNSFSNISEGINDTILLYVAKDSSKPELEIGVNDTDYDVFEYKIPIGNPNVLDIKQKLNVFLASYGIECDYINYDSTYIFKNVIPSSDNRKKYLLFKNTYDLLGFEEDVYYNLNNTSKTSFKSINAINVMADRLLRFSINGNSDFSLKHFNYCNHNMESRLFSDCNIFHLQVVNCLPYELIHYERQTENLIPIELHGNSIINFELNVRNQDGDIVEGLSDYILILDFIQIKTIDYEYKMFKILKELYMWIAIFLKNRI